jgi:hypothetical protein
MQGWWRTWRLKRRLGPPVIVVSGLPRSGTSMMMNMLRAGGLGVVTDLVREADEDNPRGYFEDERVKQLDRAADKNWLRDCRGKVVKVVSFLLKDLPDDNYYQVIFMHRDMGEVIASQNKMLARRGEPVDPSDDGKMAERYATHLRKIGFMLEERANFERLDVHYREALADPRAWAARVRGFLGLRLDLDRMVAAVDPALYRNRAQEAPGGGR